MLLTKPTLTTASFTYTDRRRVRRQHSVAEALDERVGRVENVTYTHPTRWQGSQEADAPSAAYTGSLTMTTVPEPETYALIMAGLGAVSFLARRSRSARARLLKGADQAAPAIPCPRLLPFVFRCINSASDDFGDQHAQGRREPDADQQRQGLVIAQHPNAPALRRLRISVSPSLGTDPAGVNRFTVQSGGSSRCAKDHCHS
jgi:hypothetical protein